MKEIGRSKMGGNNIHMRLPTLVTLFISILGLLLSVLVFSNPPVAAAEVGLPVREMLQQSTQVFPTPSYYVNAPPPIDRNSVPPFARRLGEFTVEWYCNQRGLGIKEINNRTQWACTNPDSSTAFVLQDSDFDSICRARYNHPYAFAIRDQRKEVANYNWSCYEWIQPPQPTVAPAYNYPPPYDRNGVPPGVRRLGEFTVEEYCNSRGLGIVEINNQTNWACTNTNGSVNFILQNGDFDNICRARYNQPFAFALKDQNKPIVNYSWSCFVWMAPPTPSPSPTPINAAPPFNRNAVPIGARRLGDFGVDYYCSQRGLGVAEINNRSQWACINPNGSISFILQTWDYDNICKARYGQPYAFAIHDQNYSIDTYNWSCFVWVYAPTSTPRPTSTPIPPTSTPIPPTATPFNLLPPADRSIVPQGTRRLGEFAVEQYCNSRGLGIAEINNQTNWACLNPDGSVSFVLQDSDFDNICRATYNNPRAFALRDMNKPIVNYSWSCYEWALPTSTPVLAVVTPSLYTLQLMQSDNWVAFVNTGTNPVSLNEFYLSRGGRILTASAWGRNVLAPGECLRITRVVGDAPPLGCNYIYELNATDSEREYWLVGSVDVQINRNIRIAYRR